MSIVVDYINADNHNTGRITERASTYFKYQRYNDQDWHSGRVRINNLTAGHTYMITVKTNITNDKLNLAIIGTTDDAHNGYFRCKDFGTGHFKDSTSYTVTVTTTGTYLTLDFIQHGSAPYYEFTFYNFEVTDISDISDIQNYIFLEYLQSNRGQYIYPNYTPSGNTKVEIKFQNVENKNVGDMDMIFGDTHNNFAFGVHANQWTYTCGKGEKKFDGPAFNALITMIFNDDDEHGIIMNDTRYQTNTCGSVSAQSIRVFARNGAGYGLSKAKIYYMKIYQNGNLVKDLIPAQRIPDNVLGMYDMVSEAFYVNSGSGTFIAGPVAKTPLQINLELISTRYYKFSKYNR